MSDSVNDAAISAPVVLVPGVLCDERIFYFLRQSVPLDNSAFVPLQWATDMAQMAMLCNDRLDYFASKVHLVGFGLGGYLAAACAIERPQQVASVTIINASLSRVSAAERQADQQTLKRVRHAKPSDEAELMVNGSADWLLQMEQDLGVSTLTQQLAASHQRRCLLSALAKQPFQINGFVGQQDPLLDQCRDEFQQLARAKSKLQVIEQAASYLPLQQPAALAERLHQLLATSKS